MLSAAARALLHRPATRTAPQLLFSRRTPFTPHQLPSPRFLSTMPTSAMIHLNGKDVSVPTGLFLDNEWRDAADSSTFEVLNPSNGQPIATVAHAKQADVDAAVVSSRKAFRTTWGTNAAPEERARLLNKLADLMERDVQFLAELESLNGGKGVRIARDMDLADSIACLRYYAGWAGKVAGETIETSSTKLAYTLLEPIGVCGQIIPWNYPIMMWAWKVAPALAAGCTIVMKPSELTPLTALALCNLIVEAGYPAGVVNVVPGLGTTAGAAIASHPRIDKVAFTGSVATGRRIMEAAAKSNLKKVTLELGGKSPSLVFPSADLEEAANWSALGIFYNSGQDCTAGSRVFVHEDVHDAFVEKFAEKARACAIGNPLDESTSFGPLISAPQRDKVLGYISAGIEQGAELVTGGKKWQEENGGFYIEPTILTGCKPGMKVVEEEIFGPVCSIIKFSSEEEAIEMANDSIYGLAAGCFTSDAKQAMRVSKALSAGTVWVNNYGLLSNAVPFGGMRQSGIGRELGRQGIYEYCSSKSVLHNIGEELSWPL
ncbi:putative aldehyde dehydrogenase [Rhodotorula diobovata]|uniref:Putative aldehyde dehydrogenase n=1 Tax=Rhodotorula diobovata TaxID=5288 RepID=A0A5C5FYD7_9BASI|nr:putative aldehyde dehydrogenase [Rhodotorula diobovata]